MTDRLINNEQGNELISILEGIEDAVENRTFLQSKSVSPSTSAQTVSPDSAYLGLSSVSVGAVSLQSKTVSPSSSQQVVRPDSSYLGLSQVTVNAASVGSKSITENGTYSAQDDNLYGYSSVTVDVDSGADVLLPVTRYNFYITSGGIMDSSQAGSGLNPFSYVVDLQDLEESEFYILKTLTDNSDTAFANSLEVGSPVYEFSSKAWTASGIYTKSYVDNETSYRYFIIYTDFTDKYSDLKALDLDGLIEPPAVYDSPFDLEVDVEKRIGKWINGKYLYQMTLSIPLTAIPNTSLTNPNKYNHQIPNIAIPVWASATSDSTTTSGHLRKDVKAMDANTSNTSQYHVYLQRFSKTQLWLVRGTNSSEQNTVCVTVRYTKTTD